MLLKKMLRDLWKNKVQFGAVFIMMFLGIFIFSGISSEYHGLEVALNNYISNNNLADAWLYQNKFDDKKLSMLKKQVKYNERMVFPATDKSDSNRNLDIYITDSDSISTLSIVKGKSFNNQDDGIWLDALYAKKNNYHLNDQITVKYQNFEITKKIIGLVSSPENIYLAKEDQLTPNRQKYGFAYLNIHNFPASLYSPNQLAISSKKNINQIVDNIFIGEEYQLLLQKNHPSVSMLTGEIAQHRSIGLVFSLAFLFIAVLITITTMHRVLQSQRIQLGILKALGFNSKKLLFHYLSHATLICLVGSVLGYWLGLITLPALIYPMFKEMYVLDNLISKSLNYGYLLPIICTLVCIIISFLVCIKYLKMNGAMILYSNTLTNKSTNSLSWTSKLPFRFQWNIRDLIRNKVRSFMTVFGILGCTALLFSACGLYDTMMNLTDWNYTKLQNYKYKINLNDNINDEEIKKIIKKTEGQLLLEGNAKIKTANQNLDVTLTVLENNDYIKLAKDLNSFGSLKQGIALSKKIADKLDLEVGDTITWKSSFDQKYYHSKINLIIRTPNMQGITIMKNEYLKTGHQYHPSAIIGAKHQNKLENLPNISSIQYQQDLLDSFDTLLEAMILIIIILVLGAIILGGVILYNLGVLSYLERYYEFSTLKVLGFKDKQIQKILVQQNIWLSIVGIILGLPIGYLLIEYMLSTIQDSMDVINYISIPSYLYAILGTLFISWVISIIISTRIKHIDMVSSLKAND